jgi:SET domain-containing protein
MCSYKKSDDLYFMSLGDGLMLDAKAMGSIARFANHSCDPNCELQKWIVQGIKFELII